MTLADGIVIAVIILIVGSAIAYIIKAKKSGKRCIGCPDGCCTPSKKEETSCSGGCSCCCGCGSKTEPQGENENQ